MLINWKIKDPDGIHIFLSKIKEEYTEELADDIGERFFEHGEYVDLVFDTENFTVIIKERK